MLQVGVPVALGQYQIAALFHAHRHAGQLALLHLGGDQGVDPLQQRPPVGLGGERPGEEEEAEGEVKASHGRVLDEWA